ncbi:hypothetical protein BKA70DRAFT_1431885 [Coprinopsis sp. MPI-PUGE-AT-0042]|nr:hypothetical protein BKA70DRAFT_1431885 [Coprinopsis sp. MPI-PUGE-AT-0042]
MTFIRTLNFSAEDLGDDVTLLLTFDDLETNDRLFVDCFPVCFKVIGFGAEGACEASIEYQSQLAFIKPQVNKKDIVSASTHVKIDLGQQTTLAISAPGPPTTYKFTKPTQGSLGNIVVTNKTDDKCEMGVGFIAPDGTVSTSLLYKANEFGVDNELVAEFTPVLRGYITSAYKQNQVLRAAIQTTCLFRQDLAQLNASTNWNIRRAANGKWSIVQAS